ncbi:cytochrome c-type biogenesis protein CcmH [Hwanghaeella grinnelliae]|uniref:Cytochrome c-type biogenesis protein n=1 Tax=Hwanghaeella grinnelliae TaxID=2500179 RepID=A0A437QPR1_9PROT|nr:cytochrome c-type biogenesis protein [Hwanghaeella grinnelliae]RVU36513.1 cytochrome c-type biogenesis protein CcmH [Hwanghaeella grinnelliae]
MRSFVSSVLPVVLLAMALLFGGFQVSWAVQPDEVLDDPVLEGRARDLSKELRCLVCQNQSIDDSNAELAKDLRVIVRERLVEGDSNDEVLDFVVARYGDYVLLRPPVKPGTYLLWFGPAAILLIAGIGVAVWLRRQSAASPGAVASAPGGKGGTGLSEAEQKRLAALMNEDRATDGEHRKG